MDSQALMVSEVRNQNSQQEEMEQVGGGEVSRATRSTLKKNTDAVKSVTKSDEVKQNTQQVYCLQTTTTCHHHRLMNALHFGRYMHICTVYTTPKFGVYILDCERCLLLLVSPPVKQVK